MPLIKQGAYIEETRVSLSNYILLFQQHRATFLKRRGGRVSLKTTDKEKKSSDHLPVATTWSMAFEKIKQVNPAAIKLISLCSFLTPDAIPEELLTENASLFDTPLESLITNQDTFNETIALLMDYSLLSREPDSHTLNMHRLIQAVIKDEMTEEYHVYWSQVAIHIISQIFPFDEPAPWPNSLRYILNAILVIEYIYLRDIASDDAIELLNTIGTYFYRRGQYDEAQELYQRALAARERLLGPEHPNTLSSVNNLASLYADQGKYDEAQELYQRALTGFEKVLGPDHPYSSRTRQNYASLQQKLQSHEG